jgi:Fe-S cluster biogenesis protein NfuA
MCDECGCGEGKKIEDLENFRSRVEQAVEKVRPALQMDGGDIKLIDVKDDGLVQVSMYGACAMCPHAQMTLKMGVERMLKEEIPEVSCVENVPDESIA